MLADQAAEQSVRGGCLQSQQAAYVREPESFGVVGAQQAENAQAALKTLGALRPIRFHDVKENSRFRKKFCILRQSCSIYHKKAGQTVYLRSPDSPGSDHGQEK
jgi:hypothetical protein